MLEQVPLRSRSLGRYVDAVGEERIERLRALAEKIEGARVLHVNATSYGGGVAELLATDVPLMRGLGLHAEWQVIRGTDDFFNVTKTIHNALQGMETAWTPQMEEVFIEQNLDNAMRFGGDWDFVVIHDPQPAALLKLLSERDGGRPGGKWIWRCHIDTSTPFAPVADFVFPLVEHYDAAVFTMADFVPSAFPLPPVSLIAPSIDPLSLKNVSMNDELAVAILENYGVDTNRPLLTQISRFDPWKDPLGVIDAYRTVKEAVPDVQLVLAGSMATDDPEGMHYLNRTETHAAGDPDVFVLTNAHGVGSIEVNAFQTCSDVVIQKSLREGFGLTVSEALWKRTPVVAGNVGGIRLQVDDGVHGFLVETPEQCASACLTLLTEPERRAHMGEAGRAHVLDNYVSTALLEQWLTLFVSLA